MSWPLPFVPREGLLRVDRAEVDAFVARLVGASGAPPAAAGPLCRAVVAGLPASSSRAHLLRALLWDFLDAGLAPAVAALLGAGADVRGADGALVRDLSVPHAPVPLDVNAVAWAVQASMENLFPGLALWAFRPLPRSDHAAAYRLLFATGVPTEPFFQVIEVVDFMILECFANIAGCDTRIAPRRILHWLEILHFLDPGRARADLERLDQLLARPGFAALGREAAECAGLLDRLAGWGPLRAAWVGAVVRAVRARASGRPAAASNKKRRR